MIAVMMMTGGDGNDEGDDDKYDDYDVEDDADDDNDDDDDGDPALVRLYDSWTQLYLDSVSAGTSCNNIILRRAGRSSNAILLELDPHLVRLY
eukprot:1039521-Pyramimonas_sp.AAC.1